MSDIIKGATVIHLSRAMSYGRGKVLEVLPASTENPEPAASVQFDGDLGRGPRTVRLANLSLERALPLARPPLALLPVAPRLRVVYSRDGAAA